MTRPYWLAAVLLAPLGALADSARLPLSWTPPSGMPPGPIEGTEALLVTAPEGASMRIVTHGFTPGHAVTVWFVALQHPELCAQNPCTRTEAMGMVEFMRTVAANGGGLVVGEDGAVRASAFLPVGEAPGNLFETRFDRPEMAEYHLVVHDHGPLVPELAADMMSGFRGGCTAASVPPEYPPSAMTDGRGGPNDCISRQVALFVPAHLKDR